jgi:hypothetical protein
MGFQQFEFVRILCVGTTRWDAIEAVQKRMQALRAKGWDLPDEAYYTTRSSPHGVVAKLRVTEEYASPAGYRLERWEPDRKRRTISGTRCKVELNLGDKDTAVGE